VLAGFRNFLFAGLLLTVLTTKADAPTTLKGAFEGWFVISPVRRPERDRYSMLGPDPLSSRRHARTRPACRPQRSDDGCYHAHSGPSGKQGFIERVRDADDRRRVFVRLRSESLDSLVPKYEALAKAYTTMLKCYTDSQLKLILDYMENMAQLSERLMADAIAARQKD
jgi:hypothetical protein